jgi:hypothetical protein
LAAFGAMIVVACGTDTIELLPLSAGSSVGSGAGTHSGNAGAGANLNAGNAGTSGGMAPGGAGSGGMAGFFPNGGRGGCSGFSCAGSSGGGGLSGNSGGSSGGNGDNPACADNDLPFCMPSPCTDNSDCRPPFRCNTRLSLCLNGCNSSMDCLLERHVCDPTTNTCVACFEDAQCVDDGSPKTRACEYSTGHCVECNERVPCLQGTCINLQCIECVNDQDCGAGRICDKVRGRCED